VSTKIYLVAMKSIPKRGSICVRSQAETGSSLDYPGGTVTNHDVDDVQQFVIASSDSDFEWFLVGGDARRIL
jgi:hypothetical protein